MTTKNRLIRLQNGAWAAAGTITSIVAYPANTTSHPRILPRVVITAGSHMHVIEFPGHDEAQQYADALAAEINDAD